ncbi:MAG: extracellular solute-binding protein [Lachnospiraceae bacterium]|nr:extracellular solute-binding protein [Lachnospiraceae bacterium]
MKKRKQILSVLLAAAMVTTMLGGCGNAQGTSGKSSTASSTSKSESTQNAVVESTVESNDDGTEDSVRISEETIEITLAGPASVTTNEWNESVQFAEYEKRLGIKINATAYDSEAWSSKLTLMLASDELPDILAGLTATTREDVYKYGQEGYLLDLSQYLDVMPNLTRIMEEYPEYARHITMENGAIYGISPFSVRIESWNLQDVYMSQTWLDNVGMDAPETLDELYEVLKAFKEQDANGNGDTDDEIPMLYSAYSCFPILWAYGIYSTDGKLHEMVDEDGNYMVMNVTENYRDYLRYIHKLYKEGLINEDAFVISSDEKDQLINNGKTGYVGNVTSIFLGLDNEGDYSKQKWFAVTGFTGTEYNSESVVVERERVGANFRVLVSADTKYPEEIAKLIDYLFTVEGAISASNGYEGLTFDFNDIEGYPVVDHTNYIGDYESSEAYRTRKATSRGAFNFYSINEGTIYDMLQNIDTDKLMEGECYKVAGANATKQLAWRKAVQKGVQFKKPLPSLSYGDDGAERATLYTDIVNYCATANVQFITGERDLDKDWDTYLEELEKMGLQRYIEIQQNAYDRLMGN